MDSLGNTFQRARKSQGWTLEQMVSMTRIQEPYLKALEEDRFDRLPQKVFAKGFVRSYARSLHLDEEECQQLFLERSASSYKKKGEDRQQSFLRIRDDPEAKTHPTIVVMLIGLPLLGLLVLLYQQSSSPHTGSYFSQQTTDQRAVEPQQRDVAVSESGKIGHANEPGDNRPSPSITQQPDASTVAKTETDHQPDIPETSAESSSDDGALTSPFASPESVMSEPLILFPMAGSEEGQFVLELRALEMTWVVVRSDEGDPQEALLRPGEIVQWQARDRFLLTLGNAGGVEVRLNGQLQGPFGKTGIVARDLELRPQPGSLTSGLQ